MKKVNLDSILEQALEKALASLEVRATAIVEDTLGKALEAKLKALLGDAPAIEAFEAPTRAKGKAAMVEPIEEAKEAKPRKRNKAKADVPEDDLGEILEGVKVALQKYSGITTPKGKAYPDVLFRRVRKVLEHAKENGHNNLASLARSALAHIATDPKSFAMSSWQYLAARLGLPVPVAQAE
jgi:ribosomal protein L22